MRIQLEPREVIQGAFVGIMRYVESHIAKGRTEKGSASPENGWQRMIEGALGEMAFAKGQGVFWTGAHAFRGLDVGAYQIKTAARPTDCLIIRKAYDPAHRFVLMIGANGSYTLRGWILGSDGMQARYWREDRPDPAYFVPQAALIPFDG